MSAQAKTPKTLMVHVVSQEGAIFEGEATAVFIKGSEGELGLYPGHSQLLTQVAPGPVRILAVGDNLVKDSKDNKKDDKKDKSIEEKVENTDGEQLLYMSGGILEVQPDCVSILADTVERPQDVNEQAALDAKARAEELIAQRGDINYQKTQRDLAEAMAKLQVLEMMRLKKRR